MKNKIYIVSAFILIFISFSVLLIYYTQEFNENLVFEESVEYSSVEINTNLRGTETFLNFAQISIGSLELDNQGIFTQIYTFPNLVGCIDLSKNIDKNLPINNNELFSVEYKNRGSTYSPGRTYNVGVGNKVEFEIIGTYRTYGVPSSQFSRENVEGILIYEIPKKERNPFDERYGYRTVRESGDCDFLKSKSEPISRIEFS